MGLRLVTPPAEEPVSLTEAKAHLRVDGSDDDDLITGLVKAARAYIEEHCRRALVTQTWDLELDAWPSGRVIYIPRPRLQSVMSISYTDANGVTAEVSAGDYIVDSASEPGRVVLRSSANWPVAELQAAAGVVVRFVAGYGAAGDVPQPIKQAMLLLTGHWYENRETIVVGTVQARLEFTVAALVGPYRVWWY